MSDDCMGSTSAGVMSSGVHKTYANKQVLAGLDFTAPAGATTLLAGLNGAGKTTWIRIALGLTHADRGQVLFDGEVASEARSHLAVVLDEPPVYPVMSGSENLYVLSAGAPCPKETRRNILEGLALTPELLAMPGRAFSLGQRRRLALAAALLRRPRYLFLDEPTIGLDPVAWEMMKACMVELVDSGGSIILTGQDFTEMSEVVSHVVVLRNGISQFEGHAEELVQRNPPRVWIEVSEQRSNKLTDWVQIKERGIHRLEKTCTNLENAHTLLNTVRSWDLPISGMGIRSDTLEEAFLSLIDESRDGGSARV